MTDDYPADFRAHDHGHFASGDAGAPPPPLTAKDRNWLTNASAAATPWCAAPARFQKLLRRGLVEPVAHPDAHVIVTAAGQAALAALMQEAT